MKEQVLWVWNISYDGKEVEEKTHLLLRFLRFRKEKSKVFSSSRYQNFGFLLKEQLKRHVTYNPKLTKVQNLR
jgi:hypothetical protein